jgi:signal transduction histidine kinase
MNRHNNLKAGMKKSLSVLSVIILAFLILAVLFTMQMFVLRHYIDYAAIPLSRIIAIIIVWIIMAVFFSLITHSQLNRRFLKPIEQFAEATHKVANGDFSVYVPPRSRPDRLDYLDIMFKDFNKMVEELGSIETLKTEFFSNVSHEIKTPLSVIQNYAEMLKDENLPPEQRREYTVTILGASRRLSDLITNMLKLTKLEKQHIHNVPEPFDLCGQLCECALLFEEQWEKKGIEFIADIEDKATITFDASLLEIVWSNLLSNAVKFTEAGGTVTLAQTSTSDEVIVSVADTGCGMDDETARRIFDKFYQGDTSHATEGNGLGLALVSRIVDLADGSITVKSELGKGSTFTVRLPINYSSGKGESI